MQELHSKVYAMNTDYYALRGEIRDAERRINVLSERLKMYEQYSKYKGVHRQLTSIKLRNRDSFAEAHSGWTFRLCERYGQQGHVEDIKQEIVAALLGKIDDYDPTVGTSLLQFAKHDILGAVHAYIRQNGGAFAVPENRYKALRRVNAIYYKHGELSVSERIQVVIEQTGLPVGKVNCGRVHKAPPLADIADKHQLQDEQSVTNRFRKIVDGIRAELKKQGWID